MLAELAFAEFKMKYKLGCNGDYLHFGKLIGTIQTLYEVELIESKASRDIEVIALAGRIALNNEIYEKWKNKYV